MSTDRATPPAGYVSPKSGRDLAPSATLVQLVVGFCAIGTFLILFGGKLYATREELVAVATSQKNAEAALRVYQDTTRQELQAWREQNTRTLEAISKVTANTESMALEIRADRRARKGSP